ncbi:hypothetical protein lerEdw1_015885 [Lerista edwardsae]|nr:hypothetical protein lerEdw1_015885 [Lerista edwardsae]
MRRPRSKKQLERCGAGEQAGKMAVCSRPTWKKVAGVSALSALLWHLLLLSQRLQRHDGAPAGRRHLTVLVWHWPFGTPLNLSGDVCAALYGIEGCRLTADRGLYGQADVVLFHHRELQGDRASLPRASRPPGQRWVWVSLESPTHTKNLAAWPGHFNWTMSYRRDSDIFVPYGELVPRRSETVAVPRKTGLATWVVSHYRRSQRRAQWYRGLARHLPVDVFGNASKRPLCPACLLPTIARYKFYLAFENSAHRDYVTEKLWRNALLAGAVPVVLGPPRANYQQFLPADSFVHVEDFGSAPELAAFLTTMNASRYRRYFEWRRDFAVRLYTDWRERFCTVCLRYPGLPKEKVYVDLERWFWS